MRPFAATLLFALAAATGCGAESENAFTNFDAESTPRAALVAGWSDYEKTPAGDGFVWASAGEARLAIDVRGDGDRLVRFRAWPLVVEGHAPQVATLYVNDTLVGPTPLVGGAHVYEALAPAAAWKRGPNQLRFQFAWTESPKDDPRSLAVAFDWVEIVKPR
jgi:hypothetical protein